VRSQTEFGNEDEAHLAMDMTFRAVLFLLFVIVVPSAIAFLCGRRVSPAWVGLALSLLWLPLALSLCAPAARAGVFASILWSFIPTIIGFAAGIARRPLRPKDAD